MLIFMLPCGPYTGVNLKEIQVNRFTGLHLLNLWDFTLIEISTGGGDMFTMLLKKYHRE